MFLEWPDHFYSISRAMASPPTFYTRQKLWKCTKICLANCKCQSPRKQQVNSRTHERPLNEVYDLISECRERRLWHADQLKLALHRVLPTSPTLHRIIVLVRRFRKSISYKIENILSEIYFAANFWSSYIPSNFSWGTTSLSTKGITTLNSSKAGASWVASQLSVNKPVSDEWGSTNMLFFEQVMS